MQAHLVNFQNSQVSGRSFKKTLNNPDIELLNYNEEEERDVIAVKMIAKKYSKLFKFLFTKYANSGYSVKAFRNFEELNDKLQKISVAEIMKMLRDHFISNRIINKTHVSEIVRQMKTIGLPYSLFPEFMIQLSYIMYTSPPCNLIHLTPVECLTKMLRSFEDAARSKGQSTVLYEDPDATTLGDKQVLEELNRRIKVSPNYSLPEGYTKVVEKEFSNQYIIPEYLDLKESERVSILLLDELCDSLFNLHFIEPIIKYK
jgi:hypothetical protein